MPQLERGRPPTECEPLCLEELTHGGLRGLVASRGLDETTRLLFECVRNSATHGPAIAAIDRLCRSSTPPGPSAVQVGPALQARPAVQVAIVPGFLYREYPASGADGRMLASAAAQLGWECRMMDLESTGRVSTNASLILQWLRENGDRPTLLASVSKGGSDIAAALQQPQSTEAFRNVVGWVDVGGIIRGSPVVDVVSRNWLSMLGFRALFAYRRWSFASVLDLRRGGGVLEHGFGASDQMRIVHVMGFPLEKDFVHPRLRKFSRQIGSEGPNDGAVLLFDSIRSPGVVYPVWGADHYMRPRYRIEPLCRGVLQYAAGIDPPGELA